jgi:hypothetical protein
MARRTLVCVPVNKEIVVNGNGRRVACYLKMLKGRCGLSLGVLGLYRGFCSTLDRRSRGEGTSVVGACIRIAVCADEVQAGRVLHKACAKQPDVRLAFYLGIASVGGGRREEGRKEGGMDVMSMSAMPHAVVEVEARLVLWLKD